MYSKIDQKDLFTITKELLANPIVKNERELVETLHKLLRFHEWKYYVDNQPLISDFEYDKLFKLLQEIETNHPHLLTLDSPTQRVANDITNEFMLVSHLSPMLSLENSYDAEDLISFNNQVKKVAELPDNKIISYCVEPKFDGGSIALVYENNVLVRAATRGNGSMGDEITPNIRTLHSVPLFVDFASVGIYKAELRGEALISKSAFDQINQQRIDDGLSLFANPRNAATGGLRTKDPNETAKRGLEAFIYHLAFAVDKDGNSVVNNFTTHHESIQLLGKLGLKVANAETKVCHGIDEVIEYCKLWQEKRDSYPYEIDGMVIKVNEIYIQERCGYTSHHPRWAIAFKFQAKQATTKLLNIEFQIGKIGSITPVAKLEPVPLSGVTVSSVSLHNEEFIKSRDIRIGDTVLVERAGDVIPYIVKALDELRDGSEREVEFPTICPSCKTTLVKEDDEAAWRCPNYHCEAQVLQRIIFHVSKDAMNIDGFGKSIVEKFYELGWIKNIADIYDLDYDKIAALDGFGVKSASNLQQAINKAKDNPIHRLLHSLSIHHLGKKASKLIAARVHHVLELKNWTDENFKEIKDIGPVVANNVMAFFSDNDNIDLLERLAQNGVNLTQTKDDMPLVARTDSGISGKTILFTGTLPTLTRKAAQEMAELAGAKVLSAVSSKLDYLVLGEDAGSKLDKAKKIKTITLLNEDEFLELIA
ncbi:MAG: NAD-dependent DNA ligase LigA [Saprospiraceae bacterium]|nr:NAD-dependent DNA ligase LigA [Saprospiraceae bacterium]